MLIDLNEQMTTHPDVEGVAGHPLHAVHFQGSVQSQVAFPQLSVPRPREPGADRSRRSCSSMLVKLQRSRWHTRQVQINHEQLRAASTHPRSCARDNCKAFAPLSIARIRPLARAHVFANRVGYRGARSGHFRINI